MGWKSPVVEIGMDAATWDVIDPLLESGRLPNLAGLMEEGAYGRLQSNLGYSSPSLWTSISTGQLPEKHGVLGFYGATRQHIRVPTIYEMLDNGAGRIGLFRWFATWPPFENAGFVVPSNIARSPDTYPESLNFINELVHPSGIKSYLKGGYGFIRHGARISTLGKAGTEIAYEIATKPEYREWLYRRQLLEVAIYGDVFSFLLRKYQPDFAAVLFYSIDSFGHQYWKYREPELFEGVTDSEVQRFGNVIDKGYMEVDMAIGLILRDLPDDALVVVVSDHGQQAGPQLDRPFLVSENLLKLLDCQDSLWMTHLMWKTVFQLRSTSNGTRSIADLARSFEQVRLIEDDRPVLKVRVVDDSSFELEVALDNTADLEMPVSLPHNKVAPLGSVVKTRNTSGVHGEYGILILKGPGVQKGHRFEGATYLDVAPTLLALRSKPVSNEMDGKVVVDALDSHYLEQNPVTYIDSYEGGSGSEGSLTLTENEQRQLEEKLRDLGYL